MGDSEVNAYEQARLRRIAENRAKLRALGFACENNARPANQHRRVKRQRIVPAVEAAPTRISQRLRHEPAALCEIQQANAAVQVNSEEGDGAQARLKPRLTFDRKQAVVAPFTLRSIGTTVWELGAIYQGPWAQRFWSSAGCLFHHAYPIGYRASKQMFRDTYEMHIAAAEAQPLFQVMNARTQQMYSGTSPTSPWTSICLAQRTGQRISGPLYFGFSDIITQRAIASLYSEQELQAATELRRLPCANPLPAELAARQFMSIEGVGESTATALALTHTLGGSQHSDLASLRAWAKQDRGIQLAIFLLSSPEMPDGTRKWPAWRHRLVPKIVNAICEGCEDVISLLPSQQHHGQMAQQQTPMQSQHFQNAHKMSSALPASATCRQPQRDQQHCVQIRRGTMRPRKSQDSQNAEDVGSGAGLNALSTSHETRSSKRDRKVSARLIGYEFDICR